MISSKSLFIVPQHEICIPELVNHISCLLVYLGKHFVVKFAHVFVSFTLPRLVHLLIIRQGHLQEVLYLGAGDGRGGEEKSKYLLQLTPRIIQ